jgi:hypothetical protein
MLIQHPRVISDFSRKPLNMSLVYGDSTDTLANRREFLGALGIPYMDLVCAKQAHSNHVEYVTAAYRGRGAVSYGSAVIDTDAFITDVPGVPVAVLTADCLSLFVYDPKRHALGLIHAGWKSTHKQIVREAVALMRRRFQSWPGDLLVHLGPCIRSCCFEVGKEFKDMFNRGLALRGRKYFLDLVAVNTAELAEAGVPSGNITDSGYCTACHTGSLFSFRREGSACGRMMSVMMLR